LSFQNYCSLEPTKLLNEADRKVRLQAAYGWLNQGTGHHLYERTVLLCPPRQSKPIHISGHVDVREEEIDRTSCIEDTNSFLCVSRRHG
jgi:hypothetical protein